MVKKTSKPTPILTIKLIIIIFICGIVLETIPITKFNNKFVNKIGVASRKEDWNILLNISKKKSGVLEKVEKLSKVIDSLAASFIDDLEEALGVEDQVKGPKEPKLLGESK